LSESQVSITLTSSTFTSQLLTFVLSVSYNEAGNTTHRLIFVNILRLFQEQLYKFKQFHWVWALNTSSVITIIISLGVWMYNSYIGRQLAKWLGVRTTRPLSESP